MLHVSILWRMIYPSAHSSAHRGCRLSMLCIVVLRLLPPLIIFKCFNFKIQNWRTFSPQFHFWEALIKFEVIPTQKRYAVYIQFFLSIMTLFVHYLRYLGSIPWTESLECFCDSNYYLECYVGIVAIYELLGCKNATVTEEKQPIKK